MVEKAFKERRSNYPMPEQEMYRLKRIDDYIESERRQDEKERLMEVKSQKKVYYRVLFACGLLNLTLIGLATYGLYKNDWKFEMREQQVRKA